MYKNFFFINDFFILAKIFFGIFLSTTIKGTFQT